ncbi:MAG: hypothetical protein V1858_00580 [Candidatus Gottesmanbacteria bacterium]
MLKIFYLIIALVFLFFPRSPILAAEPTRWIVPNYHRVLNPAINSGSTSWGNYFSNESQIEGTLNRVDVYGLFIEEIGWNDGNFLSNLVPILKKKNIPIATEGSVSGCNPNLVDGTEWANYLLNSVIKPLYDAGGVLNYYAIDAFPGGLITRFSQQGCITNIDQALPELIKFMKRFHEVHPETKFGLISNFPNYGYGSNMSYWLANDPLGDFRSHFEKILQAVEATGEHLYFLHVDNPYDYAIGAVPNPYGPSQTTDWVQRILDLEFQAKSHGLRFGLIYNSERGGQGNSLVSADDKLYFEDTLAFINLYKNRGGNPDDMIVESWYPHPSALFPDNQPYTFSYLVKNAFPIAHTDISLLRQFLSIFTNIFDYNQLVINFGK